ncbi:MAG: glycosyltransferase [Patescibacteria group bacterium]
MKIVAHTIIKNEENWIWYSLISVLDHVDEIMVYDTGSTDNTAEIIKTISSSKIKFRKLPPTADETALSKVRQLMLDQTQADWLMILDGDEIWPEESLKTISEFIKDHGDLYDSIVVPTINCVGDVFHISPPGAGRYTIAGKTGHYNLRLINLKKIPGLQVSNFPGQLQSYYDANSVKVQDRDPSKIAFISAPYLHMTHLTRSSSYFHDKEVFWRGPKFKFELGNPFPDDLKYPKDFYLPRPNIVPSPWKKRSLNYVLNAVWQTPLKMIKRRIFK